MPSPVFDQIFVRCDASCEYLRKGLYLDCPRDLSIFPLYKVFVALRKMAFIISGDGEDEYFCLSETVAFLSQDIVCGSILQEFGAHYLRMLSVEDLNKIKIQFSRVCFPRCMGIF